MAIMPNDAESTTPTNVLSEREQCLQELIPLIRSSFLPKNPGTNDDNNSDSNANANDAPKRIDSRALCKCLESIFVVLEQEDEATIALDLQLLRCNRQTMPAATQPVLRYIALQADLIKAALIVVSWIIHSHEAETSQSASSSSSNSSRKGNSKGNNNLGSTNPYLRLHRQNKARLHLLLTILHQRSQCFQPKENSESAHAAEPNPSGASAFTSTLELMLTLTPTGLPSYDNCLADILDGRTWQSATSHHRPANRAVLSFDKKALQNEEMDLIHMASTPIPSEQAESASQDNAAQATAADVALPTMDDTEQHLPMATIQSNADSRHSNSGKNETVASQLVRLSREGAICIQVPTQTPIVSSNDDSPAQPYQPTYLLTEQTSLDTNMPITKLSNVLQLSSFQIQNVFLTIQPQDLPCWQSSVVQIVGELQALHKQQKQLVSKWNATEYRQRILQARLCGAKELAST